MRSLHLTRSAVLTGALALPLVVAVAPASHAGHGQGSAYAVSGSGMVPIPSTPAVTSAGRPVRQAKADVPANPWVTGSALTALAGAGHGQADLTNVAIRQAGFTADAVSARCQGGRGSAHLSRAVVRGNRLAATPVPNHKLIMSFGRFGNGSVTLNKQARRPDGGVTVTAMEVVLPPAAGRKPQRLSLASATCAPTTTRGHHGRKPVKNPDAPHQLPGHDRPRAHPKPGTGMHPQDKPRSTKVRTGKPKSGHLQAAEPKGTQPKGTQPKGTQNKGTQNKGTQHKAAKPYGPAPKAPAPKPIPRDLPVTG
ncbi:MAG TPA: choice-of-anchor P family protein [Thermomonospora sp.]|nr:choice-of-anchor P family protein [Thermomonospora sp.]